MSERDVVGLRVDGCHRDVVQSSSKIASRQPSALASGTWVPREGGIITEVPLLSDPRCSLNRAACPGAGAGGPGPQTTPGPRLGNCGSVVTSRHAACQALSATHSSPQLTSHSQSAAAMCAVYGCQLCLQVFNPFGIYTFSERLYQIYFIPPDSTKVSQENTAG